MLIIPTICATVGPVVTGLMPGSGVPANAITTDAGDVITTDTGDTLTTDE